jgi:hypothetical protein
MYYGIENLEFQADTSEAVFMIFKKGSRRAIILAYSLPKSKLKMKVTIVKLGAPFRKKDIKVPVHKIVGISGKKLQKATKGSWKHERLVAKIIRNEFYEDIMQVIFCRQDIASINEQTLQ